MGALTPEQLDLAMKIEDIFMPHASKQRRDAYAKQGIAFDGSEAIRFVHYTSAENALSIINKKRFWMRNTTCMADYQEVQHGYSMLQGFFSDTARMDQFTSALDACVPGAAKEGIAMFDQWSNDIRFNTYITSVSEHDKTEDMHGRLSMWRAFGTSASARVAIVFTVPKFSASANALGLIFSPVAYLTPDEVHNTIFDVIKKIKENGNFLKSVDRNTIVGTVFIMLLAAVTCLKHEGFKEEREWRAIYSPRRRPSLLIKSTIEAVGGTPQIVHHLPVDATVSDDVADLEFSTIFDRLIIGPTVYGWPMYDAFCEALKAAGVSEAEKRIWNSQIPLRS